MTNAADPNESPAWDTENDHLMFNALTGTPWHKMGTPVSGLATAEEAIIASKLDWEMMEVPSVARYKNKTVTLPNEVKLWRADQWPDPKGYFGTVSRSYTDLKNTEAFQFFDQVVGTGQAIYEVAGYIDNGRRVWLLVRLPQHRFEPVPGDEVQDFLLLSNSHDGSSSVRGGHTPVRVVCRNTLNRALGKLRQDSFSFRLKHVGDVSGRMQEAAHLLSIQEGFWSRWQEEVAVMVNTSFAVAEAEQFVLDLVQANRIRSKTEYEEAKAVIDLKHGQRHIGERMLQMVETGAGTDLPGVRGSGWGLYNAAVEYVDHFGLEGSPGRTTDRSLEDRQLENMLLGGGAKMKDRARTWVLQGRDAMLAME